MWTAKVKKVAGLDTIEIEGDFGDPLAVNINSTDNIGVDWSAVGWRSELRTVRLRNSTEGGTALGEFVVTDNGSTSSELHITLTLTDSTVCPADVKTYFDVQSTTGAVIGYTITRGWVKPSGDVTRGD